MQQSSATQSLHLSYWGLRKIVAYSHSSSQCLLVPTVFGTVSSLHPTSFLMIFILVYIQVNNKKALRGGLRACFRNPQKPRCREGFVEDCCMLSILLTVSSCFNSFWHGVIPTSYTCTSFLMIFTLVFSKSC